jgi:dienelactone hydrolase
MSRVIKRRFMHKVKLYKKLVLIVISLVLAGCNTASTSNAQRAANKSFQIDPKSFPELPVVQKIEDGVVVYKIRLNKDDDSSDVWIYLPEKPTKERLPAILITAAGSYLWNGTALDVGDQPEHLPYVKKGYAVIAYETPGSLDKVNMKQIEDEQLFEAINDFKDSKAGLISEQNALNYALNKVPLIDPARIYSAGHSSAATHSLLVAANDSRVKAVIAYAPATDLEKRLAKMIDPFEQDVPGFKDFITQSSPKNNISKIKCPVFIFQATNDSVVSIGDTQKFVAELQKTNTNAVFLTVDEGEHYDSMIQQGIPKAIEWLNRIAFIQKTPQTDLK